MVRRKSGDVGFHKITATEGGTKIEHISEKLPEQKESLEAYFGERFIAEFNINRPLGQDTLIEKPVQNKETDNLDYSINCSRADYLELAEMSPLSEPWGREALRTGVVPVHELGRWVWQEIIQRKSISMARSPDAHSCCFTQPTCS